MVKKINKNKQLPHIAVKFANIVFVLGVLFSILLIVYATYKIYNQKEPIIPTFYIVSILSGVVFAALFGLGLKRLSNNLKVNMSVLFFTTVITVYGFETYLEFSKKTPEIIAKQMGVPYDTRTRTEVLNELRDSGIKAYPNILSRIFIESNGLSLKNKRIFPLGTISNSTTTLANEAGYYPIVEMDEHGFNNPKGLYIENKVDIILTGDSFTEGYSVHSNESISAILRQLDFNVISIGKGGNGPLTELAALKEYAKPLKPKIVFWLYYVSDLHDIESEMKSSILSKYLFEDDYSQNLISRQEEIDDVLINYVQSKWKMEREGERWIINLLKLSKLRNMINLKPALNFTPIPFFRDILQESKQMVSNWDGKMYFVYLPSINRYLTGSEDLYRDFVLQTATELDIPIIDIHNEVFEPHQDPLSLFPFRLQNHYGAEGYKLVAEAIGRRLEVDGYIPIKPKN
jgi:hypothetical protein